MVDEGLSVGALHRHRPALDPARVVLPEAVLLEELPELRLRQAAQLAGRNDAPA